MEIEFGRMVRRLQPHELTTGLRMLEDAVAEIEARDPVAASRNAAAVALAGLSPADQRAVLDRERPAPEAVRPNVIDARTAMAMGIVPAAASMIGMPDPAKRFPHPEAERRGEAIREQGEMLKTALRGGPVSAPKLEPPPPETREAAIRDYMAEQRRMFEAPMGGGGEPTGSGDQTAMGTPLPRQARAGDAADALAEAREAERAAFAAPINPGSGGPLATMGPLRRTAA